MSLARVWSYLVPKKDLQKINEYTQVIERYGNTLLLLSAVTVY